MCMCMCVCVYVCVCVCAPFPESLSAASAAAAGGGVLVQGRGGGDAPSSTIRRILRKFASAIFTTSNSNSDVNFFHCSSFLNSVPDGSSPSVAGSPSVGSTQLRGRIAGGSSSSSSTTVNVTTGGVAGANGGTDEALRAIERLGNWSLRSEARNAVARRLSAVYLRLHSTLADCSQEAVEGVLSPVQIDSLLDV
eukprot:GHVU01149271.1.p1 GENE.GHVU01149271.1~~GHVU01149271.1.p1  ORF type:complete len:194 (-),score=31.84 GHVU01149271.1:116-697(-)